MQHSKELTKSRIGNLNLFNVQLDFYTCQLKYGNNSRLVSLKETQVLIEDCLKKEVGEILIQSMEEDITELEKVSIYHHKLHQKNIKNVSNTGTEYSQ